MVWLSVSRLGVGQAPQRRRFGFRHRDSGVWTVCSFVRWDFIASGGCVSDFESSRPSRCPSDFVAGLRRNVLPCSRTSSTGVKRWDRRRPLPEQRPSDRLRMRARGSGAAAISGHAIRNSWCDSAPAFGEVGSAGPRAHNRRIFPGVCGGFSVSEALSLPTAVR